jgi:hypothetical protein
MRTTGIDPAMADEVRAEWQQAVEALMADVRTWAEAQGWTVEAVEHTLSEEPLGTYSAPEMWITTPRGQVILEPAGRNVWGALGRVDFAVWPSMAQVMLLRQADQNWVVKTEFGPKWPHPWGPRTFVELTEALLDEQ